MRASASGFRLGAFRGDDAGQLADDRIGRDAAEVEALRAADDGDRHLFRVGRGQDEDDVVGRLLHHLQQRVEGVRAEHVDLVDDVDPPSQLGRRGERPHHQLAGILYQAVAGGVYLDHVHGATLTHRHAGRAGVAWLAILAAVGAVDGLGQDPGGGGLAGAARPDEQIGVRGAVGGHRPAQGGDDRVLAEHLGETLRPPAAVERPMLVGGGGRHGPATVHRTAASPRRRWRRSTGWMETAVHPVSNASARTREDRPAPARSPHGTRRRSLTAASFRT